MGEAQPIVSLRDVRYAWPGGASFALELPAFSVATGESVLLLGESGSGKSTLLSLICGTITAQSGSVRVAGIDITPLSGGKRDRFRAEKIGLIFQQFNLLPYASVMDNILLPLRFAPARRARIDAPQDTVRRLCKDLGLPDDTVMAQAGTLSVGQQQRVAAARALIGAPPLIIADEPTSALDAATQAAFLTLLFDQVRHVNGTLLMVSHDARLSDQFDRVVQMADIVTVSKAVA